MKETKWRETERHVNKRKQNILNITFYPTEWQKSGRGVGEGKNKSKEVLG